MSFIDFNGIIFMNKTDFEQFLKNSAVAKKEEAPIDWDGQRQEWLNFIDAFYSNVEEWLDDYKQQNLVEYVYTNKNITEDYIGSYDAKKMDLILVGNRLTFEPIGTLLIGAKGRIDLIGPKGTIKFLLVDKLSKGVTFRFTTTVIEEDGSEKTIDSGKGIQKKEPEWTWKILERNTPRVSYVEFTQENFFQALMELVNG